MLVASATAINIGETQQGHKTLRGEFGVFKDAANSAADFVSDTWEKTKRWFNGIPENFRVRVWTVADSDDLTKYPWPEQKIKSVTDTANVGVTISGGGARSMSAAWGQLHALHHAGILSNSRYLTGLSGGGWAVTAYTYYRGNYNDDVLLGGFPKTPEEATMATLANIDEKSMGAGATTDMFTTLVEYLVKAKVGWEESGVLWSKGVREKVLSKFGLDTDDFFAYSNDIVSGIKSRNPDLDKNFITPHAGKRPFAMVHSAYMGPFKGSDAADELGQLNPNAPKYYTNLDLNGIYSGYPLKREYAVNERSGSIKVKQGGLIETFAFNSKLPSGMRFTRSSKETTVTAKAPDADHGLPMTVGAAAGASSTWGTYDHFFYERCALDTTPGSTCQQNVTNVDLLDTIAGGLKSPVIGQLATDSAKFDSTSEQFTYRLGDGGATGVVTPIHQLIARGVPKVIAFANYAAKLYGSDSWNVSTHAWKEDASIDETTPLWFGVETSPIKYGSMDYSVQHNQIFRDTDWPKFVKCLQKSLSDGNGAFCKMNLKTVKNAHWGIPANLDIELAFFYLSKSPNFEARLPKNTRDEINKSEDVDDKKIRNFPNYKTLLNNGQGLGLGTVFTNTVGITDVGDEEATLIASLQKFVVESHMGALRSMFSAPTRPPTRRPTPKPTNRPWWKWSWGR